VDEGMLVGVNEEVLDEEGSLSRQLQLRRRRARLRWLIAYTLICNPSIR
jgi:hypothetical protein